MKALPLRVMEELGSALALLLDYLVGRAIEPRATTLPEDSAPTGPPAP